MALSILDTGLFNDITNEDQRSFGNASGLNLFDLPMAFKDTGADGRILPNGGFLGRIYTLIGESGSGKSTAAIQIGGSIVDKYEGGNLVMIDAEGNTPAERVMSLNHWSVDEFKRKCLYKTANGPITIVDVYNNLPHSVVDAQRIKTNQQKLTDIVRERGQPHKASWQLYFPSRSHGTDPGPASV